MSLGWSWIRRRATTTGVSTTSGCTLFTTQLGQRHLSVAISESQCCIRVELKQRKSYSLPSLACSASFSRAHCLWAEVDRGLLAGQLSRFQIGYGVAVLQFTHHCHHKLRRPNILQIPRWDRRLHRCRKIWRRLISVDTEPCSLRSNIHALIRRSDLNFSFVLLVARSLPILFSGGRGLT